MLKCPVCSIDLMTLSVFPDACPGCGFRLTRPGTESASVQLLSDSGEPRISENEATWHSDEQTLLPPAPAPAAASPVGGQAAAPSGDDDPNNSKTFVSDEFEDPAAAQLGDSAADRAGDAADDRAERTLGSINESASLQ